MSHRSQRGALGVAGQNSTEDGRERGNTTRGQERSEVGIVMKANDGRGKMAMGVLDDGGLGRWMRIAKVTSTVYGKRLNSKRGVVKDTEIKA